MSSVSFAYFVIIMEHDFGFPRCPHLKKLYFILQFHSAPKICGVKMTASNYVFSPSICIQLQAVQNILVWFVENTSDCVSVLDYTLKNNAHCRIDSQESGTTNIFFM